MHIRWNYPPCIQCCNNECLPFNTTLVLRGFIPGFSVTRAWTHREWTTLRKIRNHSMTPVGEIHVMIETAGCFPVFSFCICWSLSSFPLHHSVSPSDLKYVFLLSIIIFWHLSHLPFSLSYLLSMAFLCFITSSHFFPQFCSLSVPALIYPVGWPLCKILWEQDIPLIYH